MFNRWFLVVVTLATFTALALAIFMDSRDPAGQQYQFNERPDGMAGAETSYGRADAPARLGPDDQERIAYVTSVLDTLSLERARLPYYGELIRIYSGTGHFGPAAIWAGERARQTGLHSDLIHAAELHLSAMQQKNEEHLIKEEAKKAKEMYINALALKPDDPDVLTDLAVVYMSLLLPETSHSMLEQALRIDPDHVRANFNMGVLLHQMGNIGESVPFFDRSLMLSDDPEWEAVVQGYLDRHHNELYH